MVYVWRTHYSRVFQRSEHPVDVRVGENPGIWRHHGIILQKTLWADKLFDLLIRLQATHHEHVLIATQHGGPRMTAMTHTGRAGQGTDDGVGRGARTDQLLVGFTRLDTRMMQVRS